MSVVFAAIAPHGSIAVAEACSEEELPLAAVTRGALEELGRRFAAAEPEATIVLTPHNVHIEGSMAIILAGQMEGDEPVPLACPVDRELALTALQALWEADVPAVGVSFGGNDPLAAAAGKRVALIASADHATRTIRWGRTASILTRSATIVSPSSSSGRTGSRI